MAGCYRNSLALAAQHKLRSIAFPCISTDVYGYPFESASRIAISTVLECCALHTTIERVRFVCFSARDHKTYVKMLKDGPTAPSGSSY